MHFTCMMSLMKMIVGLMSEMCGLFVVDSDGGAFDINERAAPAVRCPAHRSALGFGLRVEEASQLRRWGIQGRVTAAKDLLPVCDSESPRTSSGLPVFESVIPTFPLRRARNIGRRGRVRLIV